jgi:hypothetical protein
MKGVPDAGGSSSAEEVPMLRVVFVAVAVVGAATMGAPGVSAVGERVDVHVASGGGGDTVDRDDFDGGNGGDGR